MPSIVSIRNSDPRGISSAAARSNAELYEPRRKLPDIPTIVDTKIFPFCSAVLIRLLKLLLGGMQAHLQFRKQACSACLAR